MQTAVVIFISALLLVAVVSSASDVSDHAAKFHDWKFKHGKTYTSAHDEAHAFANFRASLARIAALNAKSAPGGAEYGLTSLSDLSPHEFKAQYLSSLAFSATRRRHGQASVPLYGARTDTSGVPTSFDWRKAVPGSVTPVKNQGNCGACYAFATTEALESQHYLINNEQLFLAPQQVVDCDPRDGGCQSGDPVTAFDYIEQAGVELETDYPYTSFASGYPGLCKYNPSLVHGRITGYSFAVPSCNDSCPNQVKYERAMKVAVAQGTSGLHGPPLVCVDATWWQDYTSGVFPHTNCSSSSIAMTHCAQLVGYTPKYWIVRNSWGIHWGVHGYIYLEAGHNTCGFLDYSFFPHVAKQS